MDLPPCLKAVGVDAHLLANCCCCCCCSAAAAALVVETKMNWSSAASLAHSCPSAVDAAPSVRS